MNETNYVRFKRFLHIIWPSFRKTGNVWKKVWYVIADINKCLPSCCIPWPVSWGKSWSVNSLKAKLRMGLEAGRSAWIGVKIVPKRPHLKDFERNCHCLFLIFNSQATNPTSPRQPLDPKQSRPIHAWILHLSYLAALFRNGSNNGAGIRQRSAKKMRNGDEFQKDDGWWSCTPNRICV